MRRSSRRRGSGVGGCLGSARRWSVRPSAGVVGTRLGSRTVSAWRRARRCSASWMRRFRVRPLAEVVHRSRSGQSRQATPNTTCRAVVIRRVSPAGQVAVPASSSTVKSSTVNPPGTGGRSGIGLIDRDVPGIGQRGPGLPGAVGGIAEHAQHLAGLVRAARHRPRRRGCRAPAALVSAQSVMMPVSGSTATWALKPSWRRCTVLCACRASGSTTEITRSAATWRAIRHDPSGASTPSAGHSTSWPATNASNATACAALASSGSAWITASSPSASLTSASTSAARAASSSQAIVGLPGSA